MTLEDKEQKVQRIQELIEYCRANPEGTVIVTNYYAVASQVVAALEEMMINKQLGADGEVDSLLMGILSESAMPASP